VFCERRVWIRGVALLLTIFLRSRVVLATYGTRVRVTHNIRRGILGLDVVSHRNISPGPLKPTGRYG
jgi:hypothetical protein